MGTCMATVIFTLLVNLNESILLLAGLRPIPLDPVIISLAITGIILSVILIVAALIPVLAMPLSSLSALCILILLQLYGIPYNTFVYFPSLIFVFVYFAAVAIGFVGVILSLYHLIRTYLATSLISRYRSRRESVASPADD